MMDTFNGALLLRKSLLTSMRDSPHVVRQGLLVVLLVGLLVGGVEGVRTGLAVLKPDRELARWYDSIDQPLSQAAMSAQTPEERVFLSMLRENLKYVVGIAKEINNLPTPLPTPFRAIAQGLGTLVSRPLIYFQGVLLSVIFTHITASWLGGRGSIQQMLGLGALAVAPHALDALTFIPVLGPMLGGIAWGWGLIILIAGTSFAHRLETERAALAVFFFPLIGILLAGIVGCTVLGLFGSVVASAGAQ
jgi:hypothetical protein